MEKNLSRLHDLNLSRLHDLNKRVAEERKRVEYLKKKRNALYLRKRTVDVQTWMLNNLVADACRGLKEMRRLRNNQGTLCLYLLCRIDQIELHHLMKSCSTASDEKLLIY